MLTSWRAWIRYSSEWVKAYQLVGLDTVLVGLDAVLSLERVCLPAHLSGALEVGLDTVLSGCA